MLTKSYPKKLDMWVMLTKSYSINKTWEKRLKACNKIYWGKPKLTKYNQTYFLLLKSNWLSLIKTLSISKAQHRIQCSPKSKTGRNGHQENSKLIDKTKSVKLIECYPSYSIKIKLYDYIYW